MKLAVVYPSSENEPRRNELIAWIVESIRSYIAVDRLQSARMHPRRFDAKWSYKCLKASGGGYDKDASADAIERPDHFGVEPCEKIDAAIRKWVEEKWEQRGYDNNATSIRAAGTSAARAEEVVQRYHKIFVDKKQALQIA